MIFSFLYWSINLGSSQERSQISGPFAFVISELSALATQKDATSF